MRIVLHIGTFKTGSTALQHHLAKNAMFLFERGYYYGDYFDITKAHSNIAYGLLKDALIKYGLYDEFRSHPRFVNAAENPIDVIERLLNKADGRDILISSEALYADSFRTLIGLNADKRLRAFDKRINTFIRERLFHILSAYTDDIKVLCYLRRQDLWIESQYKQVYKEPWYTGPEPTDFYSFIESDPVHLDYYKELKEWGEVFGNKNIDIKVYEKQLLTYGLLRDFYENILFIQDFEFTEDVDLSESNVGLNPLIVEYMRELGIVDRRVAKLLSIDIRRNITTTQLGFFTSKERQQFLEQHQESNDSIAKVFLGKEKLFVDDYKEISKIRKLRHEEFVDYTKKLVYALLQSL